MCEKSKVYTCIRGCGAADSLSDSRAELERGLWEKRKGKEEEETTFSRFSHFLLFFLPFRREKRGRKIWRNEVGLLNPFLPSRTFYPLFLPSLVSQGEDLRPVIFASDS